MWQKDIYSVDSVLLFGPYQRPMIQIFYSNLPVVDLVKRPLEGPKNVNLCPNFYRREGVRLQTKMSHFSCPKVPREGGCQARMGQCLIFLGFFKASLSQALLTMSLQFCFRIFFSLLKNKNHFNFLSKFLFIFYSKISLNFVSTFNFYFI